MAVSRRGVLVETGAKQSDLTPLLELVPDPVPVAQLSPEVARPAPALVADLDRNPAPADGTVLGLCVRRVRQFFARRGGFGR